MIARVASIVSEEGHVQRRALRIDAPGGRPHRRRLRQRGLLIEIGGVVSLRERLGQEVAVSDWLDVTQERIDQFAAATEDRQWIHVDPARAARELPSKTTIAHGFLTLSLLSALARRAMGFPGLNMAVNYGMNRVRFVSPVPAGSRVRGRFSPLAVLDVAGGGVQVAWKVVVEREGGDKPCAVAEWLVRYHERPATS